MENVDKIKKRHSKTPKNEQETNTVNTASDEKEKNKKTVPLKYGPLPKFSGQRLWSRGVLILGVLLYVWYYSKGTRETALAKQKETYEGRGQNFDCDPEYLADIGRYRGCEPRKCGRYVSDRIVTAQEADNLLMLANRVMALGGSSGGATIMDLHSGALSYGDKFVDVFASKGAGKILTPADVAVYKLVRTKIQRAVADTFKIDFDSLFLTHPTFFSRLTNLDPKTPNDEYWHSHVDKDTYGSFHYTSLLYLNDYEVDFRGGRFVFLDTDTVKKNVTVEPRKGRVSMFTSGAENPHFVERVAEGQRFAVTVSFTCDSSKAVSDPSNA